MNNLGVVYLDIKRWDDAITYFKAALENPLYRTPERAYSSMGYAYYRKGDYQNAEKSFREALMRNPVYPLANYSLALVYIKFGDDEKAIKELMKAIAIDPEYIDAHWELATIYMRAGKNAKALKHLEIVAEKDSDMKRRKSAIERMEQLKY
jgi:Tfp pilus assembly protein PilF